MKNLRRAFKSPLIEYANFEGGFYIQLIRLVRPYADGASYVVHDVTRDAVYTNTLYNTYRDAKNRFDFVVQRASRESVLKESKIKKWEK